MHRALLVAASLLALAACSSSSTSSSTTSAATTTATGTGTGTGTDTTTGGGGSGAGGGAAGGACTNEADSTIIGADKVALQKTVGDCGKNNLGNEAATKDCISKGTGLSDGCTDCFVDVVNCAAAKCLGPCLADSAGKECADCRAEKCDAAFETCAGLSANP